MPVAPIADHVYDHVRMERVTVFEGDAPHANHSVHIFAIHVKNWNGLAPGKLRGETRGMRFEWYGGEADLIVGDDVHGSTNGVAGQIGIVQSLGDDTLSGESGIAVYHQRKKFPCTGFAGSVMFCACAADRHRVNGFQMAGI
jgi:hypothetical protein